MEVQRGRGFDPVLVVVDIEDREVVGVVVLVVVVAVVAVVGPPAAVVGRVVVLGRYVDEEVVEEGAVVKVRLAAGVGSKVEP